MSTVNIIGSGIMGMLSAHELVSKGYAVNLFDQSTAGQESTWAGGGIISPLFPWRYDDAITHLTALSQQIYRNTLDELNEHSDINPEYCNSGMVMFDCKDSDNAKTWAKQFNIQLEPIDSKEIKKQFAYVNEGFEQALWMPQIHQIRNPRFAQLAKQSLLNRGVTFYENTPITAINAKNDVIESIQSKQQKFAADLTLICTGAWTGNFLNLIHNEDDSHVQINPVHGQMLLLKVDKPLFKSIILQGGRYIIPRNDGHILIGSTTEMIGFKKQTTDPVKDVLLKYAIQTVPALKKAIIAKHWSGLRPGSIKGIPTISSHPRIKNLFINAGHYRNGLVTAPASAQLISQIINNDPNDLDSSLYSL